MGDKAWKRREREVARFFNGERNALFLMGRTSQRENLFNWVGPVPGNKYAIVTYKMVQKLKN